MKGIIILALGLFLAASSQAETFCAACAKPTALAASGQNGASASLTWAAVTGAVLYNVEVENGSPNNVVFKVKANATTPLYVVTGLSANKNFKFKVRARCSNGKKSDWSKWYFFNAGSLVSDDPTAESGSGSCGKPSGLSKSGSGAAATVAWNAVAGAAFYNVEVENASPNNVVFKVKGNPTGTTFLVSGLTPGKNYKFKVRTRCTNGKKSDWTAWYTFNAGNLTGDEPTGFVGQSGDENTIKNWIEPLASVAVFTNPVADQLTVALTEIAENGGSLAIFDSFGKVLLTEKLNAGDDAQRQIDASAWAKGLYFVQIKNGSASATARFLKID